MSKQTRVGDHAEPQVPNVMGFQCKWIKRLYGEDGILKQEVENYNTITNGRVLTMPVAQPVRLAA